MQIEGDKLSGSDWERIRKELGLRSDIKTQQQYLAEIAAGIAEAKRFLRGDNRHSPDPETIREVHRLILFKLYPPEAEVAGKFTKKQLGFYGPNGVPFAGVRPEKIGSAMDDLYKIFAKRFAEDGNKASKVHAAIEYHAQFKAIQAFRDANGRTSSIFLERQLSLILNREVDLRVEAQKYRSSMWLAITENKFGPADLLITDAIKRSDSFLKNQPSERATSESAYSLTLNEELQLGKAQILKLDLKDVKALIENPQIKRINGLTRESLKQEFAERRHDEDAGAKDVKTLLEEALRQDLRHSKTAQLNQNQEQIINTQVLPRRR